MRYAAAALVAAFLLAPALARDLGQYEHVSPTIRSWFKSLRNPHNGVWCCDESDCKRTEQRIAGDHYEALAPDGQWLPIPADKIVHTDGNPTGEPVLCAMKIDGTWRIYCFVPGGGV